MALKADVVGDNVVEYRLFPVFPEGVRKHDCDSYLESQLDSYMAHLGSYLVEYIWQNEPFHLCITPGTVDLQAHLFGSSNYGDNVEDEWFIVYLLCSLTRAFPGLVAKVEDTDGEFLLIEAADSIPKWLNPETAENRVYIYGGDIHIIPRPARQTRQTQFPTDVPTIKQAVDCIRDFSSTTVAEDTIQKDIQRRILENRDLVYSRWLLTGGKATIGCGYRRRYPQKAKQFIHRGHAYMPAALAAILDHSPSLVAPMVQAFYFRDPTDLKACVTFNYFRPGTRVMREVRFTKCLYAQLMKQRFQPDRRSGWNMPVVNSRKFKSYDLGMKLAHGAEILCSQCGGSRKNADDDRVEYHSRWKRFLSALGDKGYFKGELEGSKLYQKLLDDAKNYFYSSVTTSDRSSCNGGEKILNVLKDVTYDIEAMRKEERNLSREDDDSWLELSPEDLENILDSASGKKGEDLDKVADNMKAFINKEASHEGAEFPSPDDEVQLDPNSFMQTMQKMFDFDDDDSNSSTDMSEYGSDDDIGFSMDPPKKGKAKKKEDNGIGDFLGMDEYMEAMDRELANTHIGESFVKEASPVKESAPPKPPPRKKKLGRMANDAPANHSKSGKRKPPVADDIDDLEEDFKPVNVDLNLVSNLLKSYGAQQGLPGPTSNILGSMGVKLPQDTDRQEGL